MRILPLSCFVAALSLACGSESSSTPSTPESDTGTPADTSSAGDTGAAADTADTSAADTGTTDTATGDSSSPDTAGACNAIDNVADVVTTTRVAEAYPKLAGGTIADGTYVVTAVTEYTGAGGATGPRAGDTMKQTLRLAGGKFEIARIQDGGAEKRSAGTFTTAGSTFTMTGTCPTTGALPIEFEATGTTVKLGLGSVVKEVITYTKK